MQARVFTLMLSGAIGMCFLGCASTSPTMRAQSPQGSYCGPNQECQTCDSGFCDAGPMCGPECSGGCEHVPCVNLPFHPVHRNFHTYDVPTDLCYPEANQPPAMYQYPYYTFRGPTDFFMK